jgi:hypothetical protein
MQLPALAAIGSSSADTDEERLQKRLLVGSTLMMASPAGGRGYPACLPRERASL